MEMDNREGKNDVCVNLGMEIDRRDGIAGN